MESIETQKGMRQAMNSDSVSSDSSYSSSSTSTPSSDSNTTSLGPSSSPSPSGHAEKPPSSSPSPMSSRNPDAPFSGGGIRIKRTKTRSYAHNQPIFSHFSRNVTSRDKLLKRLCATWLPIEKNEGEGLKQKEVELPNISYTQGNYGGDYRSATFISKEDFEKSLEKLTISASNLAGSTVSNLSGEGEHPLEAQSRSRSRYHLHLEVDHYEWPRYPP
ncbi:hypothetical protein Cgig2_004809 [Carnegiea gigantea]|uniref:Uncharacterized protein n=1 Tax=Carnegiea gigantea TaxID=171969 RepID=A0A9Q1KVM5_9CARY|nr:hypothetical protein Cgig2_004809 [Carnegiea gigantea]